MKKRSNKEKSIKGKLRLLILGVAFGLALPLFFASAIQMKRQKNTIEDTNVASYAELSLETQEKLEDMNRQVARDFSEVYRDRIDQNFQQIRKNVEAVAAYMQVLYGYGKQEGSMDRHLGIMPGADREGLLEEFLAVRDIRDYINSLPDYDSSNLDPLDLYIATESGMCLDGTDGSGYEDSVPGEYADLRKTSWYNGAKEAGRKEEERYFWTSMFTGTQSGKEKINCAVPFFDEEGKFAGAAAGDISKEHIRQAVLEINDKQVDYVLLFNEKDQVMLNPYGYDKVDSLKISDEVRLQDGYMITFTALMENGWKVCLIFRQDAIRDALDYVKTSIGSNEEAVSVILSDSIRKSILTFGLIGAAGAVCALIVANVAAGTFVRPIRRLMEQVKEVGSGNLEIAVTVDSRDEIGRLGACFGAMTKELRDYVNHLRTMTADKERIAAELGAARQIQKNMLPHRYPAYPERKDMDIYGRLRSVAAGGGNFYDFFFSDGGHFCIAAGNASGSGILTTLMAVIAKTHIKNYAQMGYRANRVLAETNNQLSWENETGLTVTAFLVIIDMATGAMDYAGAGYMPPLWKRSGREFLPLTEKSGLALGTMESVPYAGQSAALAQGDLLCLYSEGLAQTLDSRDNEYTSENFNDFLNKTVWKEFLLERIVDAADKDLERFRGERQQEQDFTMVLFRYFG